MESFVTDTDESLTKIVNGTEELWKKHNGCLRPIIMNMEYNIERHVKKYGPITQETILRMLFMRVIFTHGKYDFIVKTYVKKLKDNRKYIKEMQSWGEMQKVADRFIELVIENDETYGGDKRQKRAASLVAAQNLKPQIQVGDGAIGGRGTRTRQAWTSRPLQQHVRSENNAVEGWEVHWMRAQRRMCQKG